ncbi:hypothetical protein FJZ26_05530, partial [Candidatus Parvarchaeota archaeon]|nr:hypothetical protein [Candidatus Parvarchaeota archaeon]
MGTKATAANSQKNHKNTWHKQQWTLTPLWKRFSSVLSRLDYFERTVVGTKNQLVHPQQTLQESFRILSSLNSFFGAVRQSNPTRDELAQVESSYASLERKACDIEQKIIMLHKYSNAVDSHQPLMKLRGKADELSNEYTCAVVCGLGQIAGNEEKAFFARLSQLEHQLITLQKNFN